MSAYTDSDMDGVADEKDKCSNTPLSDWVDISGCSIKNLLSTHHFDIILGQNYIQTAQNSRSLSSLKIDYYYKNWSLQATSTYDERFLSNSLNFFYLFQPLDNFFLTLGAGLIIDTSSDTDFDIDYTASLSTRYKFKSWSFFMGLGYNQVGEVESTVLLNYPNILSYHTGLGYKWTDNLYSSLGYYHSDSSFDTRTERENISLYTYYTLDEHWFSTLRYGYGLIEKEARKNVGVSLGYYW